MDLELVVADQVKIFLYAWLLGAALGLGYELFRIPRLAVKMPAWLIFVQDLLYVILWASATFFFQMTYSRGQVRLYILVGELLGWTVYYFTVGALFYRLSGAIIAAVKAIVHFLLGKILCPLLRLLFRPFVWLWGKVRRGVGRSKRAIQRRYDQRRQKRLEQRRQKQLQHQQVKEQKRAQKQNRKNQKQAAKQRRFETQQKKHQTKKTGEA